MYRSKYDTHVQQKGPSLMTKSSLLYSYSVVIYALYNYKGGDITMPPAT